MTLHSAVEDRLFDGLDCVYINSGNAAYWMSTLRSGASCSTGTAP